MIAQVSRFVVKMFGGEPDLVPNARRLNQWTIVLGGGATTAEFRYTMALT